jgi:hypothetical protein
MGVALWFVVLPAHPQTVQEHKELPGHGQKPLASLSSFLRERLSFLHGVLSPSPNRKDLGCSGHRLPGAYAKHLIPLLGDALLTGVAVSRLIPGGYEPQVCSYTQALRKAVGVF